MWQNPLFLLLLLLNIFHAEDNWTIKNIPNLGCSNESKLNVNEIQLVKNTSYIDVLFAVSKKFKVPSIIFAESSQLPIYEVNCTEVSPGDLFNIGSIKLANHVKSFLSFGFVNIIERNTTHEKKYPFNDFTFNITQFECTSDAMVMSCIYKVENFHHEIKGVMHILFLFVLKPTTNCEIPIVSLNPGTNVATSISYANLTSTLENSKFGVEFFYGSNFMQKDGFAEEQKQIWNDEFNPGSFTSFIYREKDQFIFIPNITYYSPTPIMQKSSVLLIGHQENLTKKDFGMYTNSIALSVSENLNFYKKVDILFGGADAQPYSNFNLSSITLKFGTGKIDGSSFSVGTQVWLIIVIGFMGILILAGPALLIYGKIKKRYDENSNEAQNLIEDEE